MLERLSLLRNVGRFDSVDAGRQLPFSKLTLIYAENGRGKTTLAAILRSLQTGDANLIDERHTLAAANPPQVVIGLEGSQQCVFQNGNWSSSLPQVAIFDDVFVAENVCSGIEVATQHRQNLHELILGVQGVALNATLQGFVDNIEAHNQALRAKGDAIPAAARGNLSVEAFCALEALPNVSEAIRESEQRLAAARSAEAVQREATFVSIELPQFDITTINTLLQRGLPELEADAAGRVQAHLGKLGRDGETWVSEGVDLIPLASEGQDKDICPFCAQDLVASPIIDHYRAYFSEGYANLRGEISAQIASITAAHGGDMPAAFERNVRVMEQRREFWHAFTVVPELRIDTAAIARAWKLAREAVLTALNAKRSAPLDPITLPESTLAAIAGYEEARGILANASLAMVATNDQIAIVKEQAATANIPVLAADLAKLKTINARYDAAIAPLCQAYLDEKAAKAESERRRNQARQALDEYRQRVFPAYETAINGYLQKFGAGFRLGSVASVNNRAGSACNYNVVINNVPVSITADGGPSFRNTLSAGDRNTLALAFFFASLDSDPQLNQKIVLIDDPMTSLDEHRSLTTVQEMRRLVVRVNQVIVLSHSKPFLCGLWEGADRAARTAIRITRDGDGSKSRHLGRSSGLDH